MRDRRSSSVADVPWQFECPAGHVRDVEYWRGRWRRCSKPGAATPAWASWIGTLAGIASFSGWAQGMWFEVGVCNLLWIVASIVMSPWTFWFGVVLMRSQIGGA